MAFTDNSTGGRVMQQGLMPYRITLTDTCNVGDPIGYDESSEVWEKADADGKVICSFVAGEKCTASGNTVTVFRQAIVSGVSGAAAGDPVYIGNTAGTYTAYPGSWIHQQVGTCLSATEMLLSPSAEGLFAYSVHGVGWGGYIRAELNDTNVTQSGQIWGGLRVDFKAVSGTTVASDAYGIYVFAQLQSASAGTTALMRLEDGCASSCGVDSYILFVTGETGDPPDYFFTLNPHTPTNGAWVCSGTAKTGDGGWLKIYTTAGTRYINMYTG